MKAKTKFEIRQEKKKELNESLEYLRQVELPESQGGGSKFVRDTRKEEKKEEIQEADKVKNYLESRKQQAFGYRDRLASYALTQTVSLDLEKGWEYYCVPTDGTTLNIFGKHFKTQEGLVHILKSPKENVYVRAVGVTLDPDIDFKNIHTILEQARNTIDSEKGLLLSDNKDTAGTFKKTKNGIFLPN